MQEKSPTSPKIATLRMRLRKTSQYAVQTLFRHADWMDVKLKFNDSYQQHPEMSQHQELKRVYQAAETVASRRYFHNKQRGYIIIIYATTIIIIMAAIPTLRAIGLVVGGTSLGAVGLACWSHSRWGPKAKASLEQFHRASYNPAPPDWLGPLFKPRLNYPRECPPAREMPWEKIDFKKEPERYMHSILEYCMEGNVENGFVPQKNSRRSWYHAPWMSQNNIGREPIHGLTFERPAPVGYLADSQDRVCQSWAVAMYNEQGELV